MRVRGTTRFFWGLRLPTVTRRKVPSCWRGNGLQVYWIRPYPQNYTARRCAPVSAGEKKIIVQGVFRYAQYPTGPVFITILSSWQIQFFVLHTVCQRSLYGCYQRNVFRAGISRQYHTPVKLAVYKVHFIFPDDPAQFSDDSWKEVIRSQVQAVVTVILRVVAKLVERIERYHDIIITLSFQHAHHRCFRRRPEWSFVWYAVWSFSFMEDGFILCRYPTRTSASSGAWWTKGLVRKRCCTAHRKPLRRRCLPLANEKIIANQADGNGRQWQASSFSFPYNITGTNRRSNWIHQIYIPIQSR